MIFFVKDAWLIFFFFSDGGSFKEQMINFYN